MGRDESGVWCLLPRAGTRTRAEAEAENSAVLVFLFRQSASRPIESEVQTFEFRLHCIYIASTAFGRFEVSSDAQRVAAPFSLGLRPW
jgi:hypothetical protein